MRAELSCNPAVGLDPPPVSSLGLKLAVTPYEGSLELGGWQTHRPTEPSLGCDQKLHLVCRNGKGSHLEWRQEPQASSPILILIVVSLQSWDRRVRLAVLEARYTFHDSRAMTRSPWQCAWRPDFPGAAREAP